MLLPSVLATQGRCVRVLGRIACFIMVSSGAATASESRVCEPQASSWRRRHKFTHWLHLSPWRVRMDGFTKHQVSPFLASLHFSSLHQQHFESEGFCNIKQRIWHSNLYRWRSQCNMFGACYFSSWTTIETFLEKKCLRYLEHVPSKEGNFDPNYSMKHSDVLLTEMSLTKGQTLHDSTYMRPLCVSVPQSRSSLCDPMDYSPQAPLSMEFSR